MEWGSWTCFPFLNHICRSVPAWLGGTQHPILEEKTLKSNQGFPRAR